MLSVTNGIKSKEKKYEQEKLLKQVNKNPTPALELSEINVPSPPRERKAYIIHLRLSGF